MQFSSLYVTKDDTHLIACARWIVSCAPGYEGSLDFLVTTDSGSNRTCTARQQWTKSYSARGECSALLVERALISGAILCGRAGMLWLRALTATRGIEGKSKVEDSCWVDSVERTIAPRCADFFQFSKPLQIPPKRPRISSQPLAKGHHIEHDRP